MGRSVIIIVSFCFLNFTKIYFSDHKIYKPGKAIEYSVTNVLPSMWTHFCYIALCAEPNFWIFLVVNLVSLQSLSHVPKWWILRKLSSIPEAFFGHISEEFCSWRWTTAWSILILNWLHNCEYEIFERCNILTNGTAGMIIPRWSVQKTAMPIRIGSISLFPRLYGR